MEVAAGTSAYELERGKPIPSKKHAFIQKRLLSQFILTYSQTHEILPELNILVEGNKVVPDLTIYDKETLTYDEEELVVEQIPKGVIEILSPKQFLVDLVIKSKSYFTAGVRSYWLVLPKLTSIYVFHTPDTYQVCTHKTVLHDEVLQVEVDLKNIF